MGISLLGEEHQVLAASVRRFVEQRVRRDDWERSGAVPAEVRAQAGGLGYLEAGLEDPVSGLVLAEELGRGASGGLAAALLTTAAGVLPLLAGARGDDLADLRGRVAAGEQVVALALWEPGLSDLAGATTRAVLSENGWRLEGRKTAVVDARTAEAALVLAAQDPGADRPALFLAATTAPGWQPLDAAPPLGAGAAGIADVALHGSPAVPIGLGVDAAWDAQRRLWLAQAAMIIADAWRTWERTRDYAATREVFGRPVSKFQVNRHALAQALTRLTAARRLVYDATFRLVSGQDARHAIAAARRSAERTAAAVTDACLQLHGGYGYSLEYDVQRSWRDARALTLDGTGDALHAQIEEGLAHDGRD